MRSLATSAFALSVGLLAASLLETPTARAQSETTCGPVAYSVAEQKHVGMPCTTPTPKAEAGTAAPCGPVAYSVAEQKHVGMPCPH